MPPIVRLTGKNGKVKIGTAAWGHMRNWEFRPRAEFVKARAAGDAMQINVPLYQDYEFVCEVILDDAPPYTSHMADVGLPIAFAGQILATDAVGLVSGTGYISEHPVRVPHDDVVTMGVTVIPDGNPWIYDESPAT